MTTAAGGAGNVAVVTSGAGGSGSPLPGAWYLVGSHAQALRHLAVVGRRPPSAIAPPESIWPSDSQAACSPD
jgi:hypothetical protein